MSKQAKVLIFDTEARNKLLSGIEKVAHAVSSTLGPKGRNVAINEPWGAPTITHDGVSVAGAINLEDPDENMGAELIREAARKTSDKAGDGTTCTTILTHALIKESLQLIQAGANPMVLKKDLESSLALVLKELDILKKDITTDEEIENIATVSAADPEKGKLVAQAFKKVGKEGSITIENGNSLDDKLVVKEGMEIARGYLSPYFVNNPETDECEIENPYILITDKKLNYAREIIPILKLVGEHSKNLVIFAGEVVEEGMATLVVNKLDGNHFNLVAVQSPGYGDRRADELGDIAAFTGGQVILEDSGRELSSVTLEEFGRAERVVVDRNKTVILKGGGNPAGRIKELQVQVKSATTEFDKSTKGARLAGLTGSVAVISIGAASDVEQKEKRKRFINAINSTKAAALDGIVAGGEITLLKLSTVQGIHPILVEALKRPFKQLVENAGIEYADVKSLVKYPIGIDVMDGQVKDLIKAGIIDPVKVTRSALENSVSVAGMVISTNTLISDKQEDKS